MNPTPVLESFLAACKANGISLGEADATALTPAVSVPIAADSWGATARIAREQGLRFSAFWADPVDSELAVFCLLEKGGEYLLLRTRIDQPVDSLTPFFPAADRPERHAGDLLGIRFLNAPDSRRWTRHQAWAENDHPLLPDYPTLPAEMGETPPDPAYPFVEAQGSGVVEIPVGPVHAGIIEPGHFRFQAVGETVLNLEQHLGYVHKGVEKIAVGRDPASLVRLAGRVSGDSTAAHAWAACQALERAAAVDVPPRALWLRAIMAERERIANHLGDIGAICNDVGFAFAQYQLTRIKEELVRENLSVFGHRMMMDRIVPGGVDTDLTAEQITEMAQRASAMAREVARIIAMLEASESLEDRLMTTGRLTPEQATRLGAVGYVGKASGCGFDLRRDAPYAPYENFTLRIASYRAGDVAARAKVRAEEIDVSLWLLIEMLHTLPKGDLRAPWPVATTACEGIGLVEGWRGEIVTYVRLDAEGRVARFFPRDPSWLTWPALELMIQGNIVPDFPVCNKSVNGSYSGHDL